jgi:hypothetical protein
MMGLPLRLRERWVVLVLVGAGAGWTICSASLRADAAKPDGKVEYDRDIRPILSNNCFKCHGPDARERQVGLRLDIREEALKPTELGGKAIIPGKPEASALVTRISSPKASRVMPPPESGKKLTANEKDLLKRWIEQGAVYQRHWSFLPPRRPPLPKAADAAWPRAPIDSFILARLEAEGLRPAPEGDKVALIRRLTLDLTGLPPTPAEVDAFVNDARPNAYEKVVDRLLASPRFGERLAVEWLDAARYADTHGYHIDSGRDMTRWREWVIDAFNRNLPFDRFTVEQLAGDLLPSATFDQRIASGFNRNHMINFEGGAIPEEYHTAYIVDRVNTTATVWLGLTVACCQCHDHKYDPITQKEFYQLYAFFHNLPENGLDGAKGNAAPVLKAPTRRQQQRLDELAAAIHRAEAQLNAPMPELDAAQERWEKHSLVRNKVDWTTLDPHEVKSRGGATLVELPDHSIRAQGANPPTDTYTVVAATGVKDITAIRLEALPDEQLMAKGPGRSSNGNIVLTDVRLLVEDKAVKFKTAWADFSQKDFPVAHAIDGNPTTGWAIFPEVGKAHTAVFELEQPIHVEGTAFLTVTLDFRSPFAQHQLGRFRLSATGAKQPTGPAAQPAKIGEILALGADQRSDAQQAELRVYFRTHASGAKQLGDRLEKLRNDLASLEKQVPTAMVMQEMPKPRDTFLLVRGQYDKKGEKVSAGVPACLPPLGQGAPANRLGLAEWLVDPAHPLTARVAVNRYWQMFFGNGLVKTAEDFGSQGELPSHPELLDWLAVEFMSPSSDALDGGPSRRWDIKAILKLMVMSATYRQSSAVTPALMSKDPENRLLARGPRLRLQAEFIRDQALSVSGLLVGRIGGRSVSPYQPAGLWEELASRQDGKNWTAQTYVQSHGPDLYRRTMYTFWKRTSPPPTLTTFDAPDRETCTVRRARTNTPLQALVLMNDPTYVEAARKLGERLMTEAVSVEERITLAFRLVTARRPKAEELGVLRSIFAAQLATFRQDQKSALRLLSVGEAKRNEKLDVTELAAWTAVASVILNLDETVTKG